MITSSHRAQYEKRSPHRIVGTCSGPCTLYLPTSDAGEVDSQPSTRDESDPGVGGSE